MKNRMLQSLKQNLYKNNTLLKANGNLFNKIPAKSYIQVKDLNQTMLTAELEESQRKAKFLEYTNKIYKPSKTITFDRSGEVLLFSCDNLKHSQVYLKYPYCMYDSMIPLAVYIFFCDPFSMAWQTKHAIFHFAWILGWMPHFLYVRSLTYKIHKIFLMRGGKYCRIELQDWMGATKHSWVTIREIHLLSEDHKRFEDTEKSEFLLENGQLKYEVGAQLDNWQYYGYHQNDDVIYLMKEGTVHQPELLEQVLKGYNIDTTDFEINTEDNLRMFEPNKNY